MPITFWDLAVIVPVSFIIQMLPVSVNGFGVREATFAFYFSRLGLPISSALLVSLMATGLMMLFSLSGAAVLLVAQPLRPRVLVQSSCRRSRSRAVGTHRRPARGDPPGDRLQAAPLLHAVAAASDESPAGKRRRLRRGLRPRRVRPGAGARGGRKRPAALHGQPRCREYTQRTSCGPWSSRRSSPGDRARVPRDTQLCELANPAKWDNEEWVDILRSLGLSDDKRLMHRKPYEFAQLIFGGRRLGVHGRRREGVERRRGPRGRAVLAREPRRTGRRDRSLRRASGSRCRAAKGIRTC